MGNGVLGILGMGVGCKQLVEGPSGLPGDAVAVASVPGNWVSLAEFRGSTLIWGTFFWAYGNELKVLGWTTAMKVHDADQKVSRDPSGVATGVH